ncbi:MAG: hypothetical protein PHT55_01690 [Spirochaetales bacterium]|nr:hypothetical protein [Spirochaetales bacterium]
MKKLSLLMLFVLFYNAVCFSQPISANNFLGTWMQMDNRNYIEIVKEQGKYLVIEYRAIKHELFFSGDGKSAVFVAFGKGPPGFDVVMLRINENKMDRLYFTEEHYDWELSQYSYYKK